MMECPCVRAAAQKSQNFGVLSKNEGKMTGSQPRAPCNSRVNGSKAEKSGAKMSSRKCARRSLKWRFFLPFHFSAILLVAAEGRDGFSVDRVGAECLIRNRGDKP